MNWLITGGCGFIGTSLIQYLLKQGGHAIRVLDDLSVGTHKDLAQVCDFTELDTNKITPMSGDPEVCLVQGDIRNEELALAVAQGANVIVHLAANTGVGPSVEDPRTDCTKNVTGIFNYLEAARQCGVRKFIFASSGATVGECTPPIHEEMPQHPVSPYGASKLAGEAYCSAYFSSYGVETTILRFGNVYGPGSSHKGSVVAKFIRGAMNGEDLEIFGDGTQTRDFIYIEDLIQAIVLAVNTDGVGGEAFQIATNAETTVLEMTKKLISCLHATGHNTFELRHSQPRLGDVHRNFSDTSKAKKLLGWQATTDLESGLEKTVKWFTTVLSVKE